MKRKRGLSRRVLRAASSVLAAGGLGLAAAAVSPAPAPAGESSGGGILRLGFVTDLQLDPALAYDGYSMSALHATCANLFNYPDRPREAGSHETGSQVVPEVVRRTTVSRHGRVYTFDLKRTFRFQTGAPVDAASFAAAFNRDADPQLKSPAATVGYLHEIVGADAVRAGKASSIAGVRVLAPYRLQIRLTRPLADLAGRLTLPFFCPLLPDTPRHALDSPPGSTPYPAGSGPFYLAEHVGRQRLVLRRNPYYRGDRPVHVDEIDYTLDMETEDCVAATEQNRVDECVLPTADNVHRALAKKYGINRPGGRYFVRPGLNTYYIAFNHDRPAFNGPGQIPLAKAINYAIDRPALARAFGYLGARRTDRMLPPAFGQTAGRLYPIGGADPSTARKWLAKARYKPDKLVLYTRNDPSGVKLAEVLDYDLRQLGIELEIKYFSEGTLYQKMSSRGEPFDITLTYWGPDYPDPITFFRPLLYGGSLDKPGNFNFSYLDDPEVNAAIDAADRLSGDARRQAFAALDAKLMRDNPPWAPFANSNGRIFVSAAVGCVVIQPVYGFDIAAACKK